MSHRWSIRVYKEYFKFSAAHFLIFADGTAERLHGHNYQVEVELRSRLDAHGLVLDFRVIKPLIREVVDELDEYLLLPGEHPVLRVTECGDGTSRVDYQDRHYVIPTDEIRVLPLNNTSAENLARHCCQRLLTKLSEHHEELAVEELVIGVEETRGQRGVYHFLGE